MFLGAGGGRTWDGIAWRTVLLGEGGLSLGNAASTALFTITPTSVNDSIRYADAQASLLQRGNRVDVGALIGARFGDQVTIRGESARAWASVSAALWFTSRIAAVASGGTYPIDPTEGFPGGRFMSLTLRIATARRSAPVPATPVTTELPRVADTPGAVTGFSVERDRPGFVTLEVISPRAQLVEISGDFTEWVPLRLTPVGASPGLWSATVPLQPGSYQLNVRVDGGPWLVPPGLLSMLDEFGGSVGLLVIE
jgi:hypothetical protein